MLWKNLTASICAILSLQFSTVPDATAAGQTQQQPLQYEAPLGSNRSPPSSGIFGSYGVRCFPGHSLAQHLQIVGADLTPHIRRVFDYPWMDYLYYSSFNIGDDLLAKIRADPGVEAVDYDFTVELD